MAEFVVLEDFQGSGFALRAGETLDDQTQDIPALRAAGVALVPKGGASQSRAVAAFLAQARGRKRANLFPILAGAGVDELILKRTTGVQTIEVDGALGNDSNTGLPGSPLASLAAAEALAALVTVDEVVVRVRAHPGAGYVWPTWRPRVALSQKSVWVIFDEVTELIPPSAAQGGSGLSGIVTLGGLVADALNGKTVEVLTGPAAGDRRMILRNTVTDLEPVVDFSAAVGVNDTFRVFEPAAGNEVFPTTQEPMVLGLGITESPPVRQLDTVPGLRVVNARIEAPIDLNLTSEARIQLFGCEIHNAGSFIRVFGTGQVLFGRTAWDGVVPPASEALGTTAWIGWGVFWSAAFPAWFDSVGYVSGYVVTPQYWVFAGEHDIVGHVTAGNILCQGSGSPQDTRPPRLAFGSLTPLLTPQRANSRINSTAAGVAAIDARNEVLVLVGNRTIIDAAGPCIHARNANVRIILFLTLNTGTVGLKADRTGEIAFVSTAPITIGVLTGNEVEVGNTPAFSTIAAISAAGAFLKDTLADDNSIVHTL